MFHVQYALLVAANTAIHHSHNRGLLRYDMLRDASPISLRTLRPSPHKNEKELHKSLKHVWGKIKDHMQLAQLKMKGHLELSQMAVKEHFEVSFAFFSVKVVPSIFLLKDFYSLSLHTLNKFLCLLCWKEHFSILQVLFTII